MRIRQPREVAELKGAVKHDPQRYSKKLVKSSFPLGKPPDRMSPEAKRIWSELETYGLPGVYTASERFYFELASNLYVEYLVDPAEFSAARMARLIDVLGKLGLNPSDRQKFGLPKDGDQPNDFNDF